MLKPRTIFHLVQRSLWEAAKASGSDYRPPTFHQVQKQGAGEGREQLQSKQRVQSAGRWIQGWVGGW